MKKQWSIAVALLIVMSVLTSCSGIDSWRLQGTWEAYTTIGNATITTYRLVIDEKTFDLKSLTLIPTGKSGTFTVDAFSDPKEIDLAVGKDYTGEGSLQLVQTHDPAVALYGIYQISGDELKIQFGDEGNRPQAFDDDKAITLNRVDEE
jgi:uncharacterized protein (TIGR03067 family)